MSATSPAPAPGFRHSHRTIGGVRLHAVIGGTGPAVVLLHGWPFTWRVWRPLLVPLSEAGYTVVAPDLHGVGESGPVREAYRKQQVADDLHQFVVDLTGQNTLRLAGMDLGTMVAFAWATRHRDAVSHLVLTESVLPGFGLEELMNPATGGYWHFGFHLQTDLATWLTEDKAAGYIGPMLGMTSASGGLTDEDRDDIINRYAAPGGMRGGFQHYATLLEDGRDNRTAAAEPLTAPVLVLNGSAGLPQHQLLDGVRRAAVDVRADTVPHSGHTFAADNPDWTADRLATFFRTGN